MFEDIATYLLWYSLCLPPKWCRQWSDEPLPQMLKYPKYPDLNTQQELKEKLYYDIIKYFKAGKVCGFVLYQFYLRFRRHRCEVVSEYPFWDTVVVRMFREVGEYFHFNARQFDSHLCLNLFIHSFRSNSAWALALRLDDMTK